MLLWSGVLDYFRIEIFFDLINCRVLNCAHRYLESSAKGPIPLPIGLCLVLIYSKAKTFANAMYFCLDNSKTQIFRIIGTRRKFMRIILLINVSQKISSPN